MPLHLQRMGSMVARHSQWSSCLRVSVILIVFVNSISGLVVEYIVAIDVTRVRFPADAYLAHEYNLPFTCHSIVCGQ